MFSDVLDMIDGMSVITTAFRTDKKEEKNMKKRKGEIQKNMPFQKI